MIRKIIHDSVLSLCCSCMKIKVKITIRGNDMIYIYIHTSGHIQIYDVIFCYVFSSAVLFSGLKKNKFLEVLRLEE